MKKLPWKTRDTVVILLIPFEFLCMWLLTMTPLAANTTYRAGLTLALRVMTTLCAVILFRDLLGTDFSNFKRRIWIKLPICFLLALAIPYVLQGIRRVIHGSQSFALLQTVAGELPVWLFIFTMTLPLFSAFLEEIIFRYVLFMKFANHGALNVVMYLLSAFLFGAVHLVNMGGDLIATIPYMVIGLVYNLIYLFTKNIWYTLCIHFLFNFMQSVWPILQLIFINLPE